ncbi:hypothetical protein HYDPIDRAFT_119606 [Hydnomerulius pinastri MD-312]|uniref:Uncharacterized protein n=1 Tax=Hydnomerulius pinastri MD-312 TaxID=994086 RepID=A0A0C9VL91_9AGAM|nr:hypothetical protein HYDPIDRAFT_119606 [Hydnomerulius pinastri MD-312]
MNGETSKTTTPLMSIRRKLNLFILDRSTIRSPTEFKDAWVMIMPTLFGFERSLYLLCIGLWGRRVWSSRSIVHLDMDMGIL